MPYLEKITPKFFSSVVLAALVDEAIAFLTKRRASYASLQQLYVNACTDIINLDRSFSLESSCRCMSDNGDGKTQDGHYTQGNMM